MRRRFDRFAVLRTWDYRNPDQCTFEVERVGVQGGEIPIAVEQKLLTDLFDAAAFERLVVERARESSLVGDLLDELSDPPPPGSGEVIPFLGETVMYEEILKIVAAGNVVVNVNGTWIGRLPEHPSDDEALRYIRSRAFRSGQEMRQIQLGLPGSVGGTTVTAPPTRPPVQPTGQAPSGGQPPVGPGPVITPQGGGDDATTVVQPPVAGVVRTERTIEPTTGINLSGYFERWGISSGTILNTAKVEFEGVNVQQLKQILQRLPSSVRASLEVSYPDEDPS